MSEQMLRQLLRALVLLFLLSIVVFFGMHVGPRTPTASIGVDLAEERRLSIGGDFSFRSELLGDYISWLGDAIQGDLGDSSSYNQPVSKLLMDHALPSLQLITISLFLAFSIGLSVTYRSLHRPRSPATYLTIAFSRIGIAIPIFVLGQSLLLMFNENETLLPITAFAANEPLTSAWAYGLLLPVASLAASFVRFARTELAGTSNLNSVRTARGNGLPERLVLRNHQLRLIFVPLFSTIPIMALEIAGGLIAIETLFDISGLGSLTLESAGRRDFAVLQGVALIAGVFTILLGLFTNTLGTLFDARLRPAGHSSSLERGLSPDRTINHYSVASQRRRHRFAIVLCGAWIGFIVAAPLLIDRDPAVFNLDDRFRSPDLDHLLGTDDQGRDIFIRTVLGAQHSLQVGLVATAIALPIALALGLLSGSNRFIAATISPLLLILCFLIIYDAYWSTLLAALVISTLSPLVDTIATGFRRTWQSGYVEAARAIGNSKSRLFVRYLLPPCLAKTLDMAGSVITTAIIAEATISFLGFNPRPQSVSLGEMIGYSRAFMITAPWALVAPALALGVTLLLVLQFSSGLRQELQPELQALLPPRQ